MKSKQPTHSISKITLSKLENDKSSIPNTSLKYFLEKTKNILNFFSCEIIKNKEIQTT